MPLRDTKTEYHPANGQVVKVHPALAAQFQHSAGVPDWAREAVKQLPGWGNGLGHNEDPFTRCGVLDTDVEAERQGWTPEDKEFVEAALTKASSNGVEYVICSAPKAEKPWPKYDEIEDAEQAAWQIDQAGYDIGQVKRYEKENRNREDFIAAFDALQEKLNEDVVGVISA